MAPIDRIRLPFRWQFVPVRNDRDGAIEWAWRAYTHSGELALQSECTFETLTECLHDAKRHGYSL